MPQPKLVYEGHAPGAIRDAFLDAVDSKFVNGAMSHKLLTLCGQLTQCTDVLPGMTCELLGLPAGSTYGQGAEMLLGRSAGK